jgi:hypothetical protein
MGSLFFPMPTPSYPYSSTPQHHTESLMETVPLSVLSPDISMLGDFHTTPFAAAAEGVSQILSKVGSVDDLIWSVGTIQEWFLQSVEECGIDYVDALKLTMKLDWHTHASQLGVDLSPPSLNYLIPSSNNNLNLLSNENSEDNCDNFSDEFNFNIPPEDFDKNESSEGFTLRMKD